MIGPNHRPLDLPLAQPPRDPSAELPGIEFRDRRESLAGRDRERRQHPDVRLHLADRSKYPADTTTNPDQVAAIKTWPPYAHRLDVQYMIAARRELRRHMLLIGPI